VAKGFVFKLQAVLDQRTRAEEEWQRAVAALEHERIVLETRIRGCQQAIETARNDLRDRLGAERGDSEAARALGPLADVRMQANASLDLVNKAQQAVLVLAGLHKRLDGARLNLLKAAADRKAVELLKTRQKEEWRREELRKETAELDEMSVMRHARKGEEFKEDAA